MISLRMVAIGVLSAGLFSATGAAQSLSKYRDFEFGMSVDAVAKHLNLNPSDARTVHQRPALIQSLNWANYEYSAKRLQGDSLRSIRFDFYNDELSKIVVTYDSTTTEGLTTGDMIEAISAVYGPAVVPDATISVSWSTVMPDNQKVLARWEDSQYSYNLFRFSYGTSFGLAAFSKRLDLMARVTSVEASRLDELEAPAREAARLKKQEDDWKAAQEKARLVSKPNFRP